MKDKIAGRPTTRDRFTRTFINAVDADAFVETMGKRVTGMAYGTESVKVTVRAPRFADTMPEPMPRFDSPTSATPFNTSGSISFREGSFGTK